MSLSFFLILVWSLRTFVAILDAVYYWQLKEYRWDRMKVFLFQQGGHQHFWNVFHLLFLGCALVYGITWVFIASAFEQVQQWIALLLAVLFLAELLRSIHHLLLRQLKRPRITLKSSMIVAASFGFEMLLLAAFWFISPNEISEPVLAVALCLLAILEYDIVSGFVVAFNYFSNIAKRRIFRHAQALRLSRKDLIVVGITGSYGKTSVKEYLTHVLSSRFKVLKTEKNTNTEIGIAQTILDHLRPDHQVFVCEMGAYHKGEIAVCCQIARPQIGIFTGLNNQHAALFGSLDETFNAKWELISSLPENGLAVFNADSVPLQQRILAARPPMVVCSTREGHTPVSEVVVGMDSVAFTYKSQRFEAPLSGSFQVVNLLMVIQVAEHLGLDLPTISQQLKTLRAPEKTMVLHEISKGYLIDDSYNVNSDGLKQAVLHLDQFPDYKRVLIFPGILELGEDTLELHEKLGEFISHHVDYAFFTDPNFSPSLRAGALRGGLSHAHVFVSQPEEVKAQLSEFFENSPSSRFVFLFESRGAEKVMEWLLGQKPQSPNPNHQG